jgi:hypothetical protein
MRAAAAATRHRHHHPRHHHHHHHHPHHPLRPRPRPHPPLPRASMRIRAKATRTAPTAAPTSATAACAPQFRCFRRTRNSRYRTSSCCAARRCRRYRNKTRRIFKKKQLLSEFRFFVVCRSLCPAASMICSFVSFRINYCFLFLFFLFFVFSGFLGFISRTTLLSPNFFPFFHLPISSPPTPPYFPQAGWTICLTWLAAVNDLRSHVSLAQLVWRNREYSLMSEVRLCLFAIED